jgi:flagellar hook-associated protein 2
MSTSGVNLSSLLSTLGSSSSGINVQAAVAQAIAADSAPVNEWEQEQVTLQTQSSTISSVENDITTLQTSLNALSDPAGALTSMAATSSNTAVVTASAASGTASGNHVVVVNNLAATAAWYSGSVASSSTPLTPGSFDLQVGSGAATPITIGSGVNTLDQLASYINGLNLGVNASVVNDSSGSRLAIVSASSGAASNFTISNPTGLNFTQAVVGTDASLTVDGIPIDSASNTVTGAVNGLTLNLQSASPNTEVNVSIAPDSGQVSQAITNFVNAYNTVIGDVNSQYTINSNQQEGPLAGDSTLRMLQSSLLSAASYSSGSGTVSTLADLGITMNNDGTLNLDNSTLSDAIQNNFGAVQSFLQGTSSNGFASVLNGQMTALNDPTTGAFTVDLQSISNENTDLQNHINDFQVYLQSQQTLLTNEYNQADVLLQQLPQEEAQINAELGYPPNSTTA